MLNLLFSPSGRINSSEFMKGAITLVILAVILALPEIMGMKSIAAIASIVSLVLLYCWVALWIKRYHDGGKSGWMSLVPILVYVIAAMALMFFMMGDVFAQAFQAAAEGEQMSTAEAEAMAAGKALPYTIANAVLSLAVAFLFNSMIKHDPSDNQYGPA